MKPSAAGAAFAADLLREIPVDGEKQKQEVGIGQKPMAQLGHS
jgi:hypothetical protein